MQFRVSLGCASCRNVKNCDGPAHAVCKHILRKIEDLKLLKPEQLRDFSKEDREYFLVGSKKAKLTVFCDTIEYKRTLIVVQAFYPTWKRPNYFSAVGVGRIFAEGILIEPDGSVSDAGNELLWEYR